MPVTPSAIAFPNDSTIAIEATVHKFAPVGKAMSVLQAQESLPSVQPSGAWQQANERYFYQWRQALQEETARSTREFERGNAVIISMGHANVKEMQDRGAVRDQAFVEHEQQVSDHGAMFRGLPLWHEHHIEVVRRRWSNRLHGG